MEETHPYGLKVQTIRAGRDFVILITGGAAHIGAVATSYWSGGKVETELQTLPTHREGELARSISRRAAEQLGAAVTVIAGIHIDQATKEDISRIVEETERLAEHELQSLLQDQSKNVK